MIEMLNNYLSLLTETSNFEYHGTYSLYDNTAASIAMFLDCDAAPI